MSNGNILQQLDTAGFNDKEKNLADQIADSLQSVANRRYYREHPDEYLGLFGKYWSKQSEIIKSVRDNKITLVRSANDLGKTYTASATILWFMDVYRPYCKVISTAKTYGSVRFMLWTRIREMYKSVAPRFNNSQINVTEFIPDPKNSPEWFAIGYNPKIEGDEATSFQGHHAKNILFLVDEAITTHPAIWRAIEGSLLSSGSRLLAIYNPTTTSGEVFQMENDKRGNVITISAYDLFEDEEYKKDPQHFEQLVSPEGAKMLIDAYGEDSPIVKARIFGDWADEDETTAISYSGLHKARERAKANVDVGDVTKIIFSWDVAGEGGDDNVLGMLSVGEQHLKYETVKVWKADHSTSMGIVYEKIEDTMKCNPEIQTHLIVDTIGEGSHVPSIMRQWIKELTITSFKAGYKSKGVAERKEMQLSNTISEAWYRSHLLIEEKIDGWKKLVWDVDDRSMHELTTRKRTWGLRNKEPLVWSIEPKDEYKARNRRSSPDRADAFVMAIYGWSHTFQMKMFSI